MNKRQKKKQLKLQNKKLVKRYPFLLPRNVWTDILPKDYDYTYTLLDEMPEGWRKSFGLMLCEEIRQELIEYNYLYNYRVIQIKEKFGGLRWYDNGAPGNIHDILRKYEYISEFTCIYCGKFNVSMFDDGWVCPYCDPCFINKRKNYMKNYGKYINPDETKNFNPEEELEKYRLEDEEFKPILEIESMGKNGCNWRTLDTKPIINKMKKFKPL